MIQNLLKNNIILSISSIISLLINIISIPIITRIYNPENIGIFASLQLISTILFPIIGMRMEIIFGQKIDIEKLKSLFNTSIILGILISIGFYLLIFFTSFLFSQTSSSDFIGLTLITNYLFLIIFLALLWVYFEFSIGLLNHLQLYKHIALFSVSNILIQRLLQIIFGIIFDDKVQAIFLSYCIANLLIAIFALTILNKKVKFFNLAHFNLKSLYDFQRHIIFRTLYTLGDLFKDRLILLLILSLFTSYYAGLYSQSLAILAIPISIFSVPLKTLITREYSSNKQDVVDMIKIIYNFLIFLVLPFYIFIYFHSSYILPLVLGQEWAEISNVFNILLIPMFILIFATALDRLYDVLNLQKWALFFQFFFGIFAIITFLVLSSFQFDFFFSVKINAIILSIFFLTFGIFIISKTNEIHQFYKLPFIGIAHFLFCFTLFHYAKHSLSLSLFLLLFIVIIGLFFCLFIIRKSNHKIFN